MRVCVYVCLCVPPNHSHEMKPEGSNLTGSKVPGFWMVEYQLVLVDNY